jgi:adhesin/invasin
MKIVQHKIPFTLALLSLSCWNATAQNLISDPGFQAGTPSTSYEAGSTSLPGWTVDATPSGGVQLFPASTFGTTQTGDTLVLQLTGGSSYADGGGVSQTIATTPDLTYTVSIDVANRATASGSCSGNFSFGGQDHAITASSHTFTTLAWTVTAASDSTLIDITANSGANPQLLIDNVSVTPPAVADAANSTVTASSPAVAADGTSTSTITVTLLDAGTYPVPGKTVTLAQTSGPGTAVITPISDITDGNGQATFAVASGTVGSIGFAATDVTDADLAIAQTATVTFVPLVAWGAATTVTDDTDVATNGVLQYAEHWGGSDGTINGVPFTAAGVNVTKSDGTGFTQTVSWSQGSLSTAYYNLLCGNWYNAGNATISLNNLIVGQLYQVQLWSIDKRYGTSQMETYSGSPAVSPSIGTGQYAIATFTATAATQVVGVTGAGVINAVVVRDISNITAGPVDAGYSTVVASPVAVMADGSATATITVTLQDADRNPVPNRIVALASDRGVADTISAASGVSSATGVVTFTVSSTTPGPAILSATDVTDSNIAITQSATVTFTTLAIGGQQFSAGDVLPSPIVAVSGDLLETRVADVTGEIANTNLRNGTTGTAQEGSAENPAAVGMTTVTYSLDLTASPSGYDIREILLFSGWGDARTGQSYRIEYALAASPSTFAVLGTVSAALTTSGSLLTRTYDLTGATILTGVGALRFMMIDDGLAGSGTVFREIDVLGAATGGNPLDYNAWAANYPSADLTNPVADADGDGMTNQQEYAFGLDPSSGSSVSPIPMPLDPLTSRFQYTRRATSGLTYTVLTSTDLLGWQADAGASEVAVTTLGDVQTVTVHVSTAPVGGKLFVRVQAQ